MHKDNVARYLKDKVGVSESDRTSIVHAIFGDSDQL